MPQFKEGLVKLQSNNDIIAADYFANENTERRGFCNTLGGGFKYGFILYNWVVGLFSLDKFGGWDPTPNLGAGFISCVF